MTEPARHPILHSYRGTTPTLDGVISPGEWDDATRFTGVRDWVDVMHPVTDDRDLSLVGYVKHDHERLYFAFDVTDDVLYGLTIPRWNPPEFPNAQAWPWFGDGMEILINASNDLTGPAGAQHAHGDGRSFQMVCSTHKSHLGGLGVPGLALGEPGDRAEPWATYDRWIRQGHQRAAVTIKPDMTGYVIEWSIRFDPCLELRPGVCYDPSMPDTSVGLNLAVQDLDQMEKGVGAFAHFHHESWWSKRTGRGDSRDNWGTLILMQGQRPDDEGHA